MDSRLINSRRDFRAVANGFIILLIGMLIILLIDLPRDVEIYLCAGAILSAAIITKRGFS